MARMILFATLLAGLALSAAALVAALRGLSSDRAGPDAAGLPEPLRLVAFVFLFLLTTGVSTGLLGAG